MLQSISVWGGLLPLVACLAVYWGIGDVWFQQDDFAHLKLAAETPLSGLPAMMMRPIAQGTFRPLSERLFFWGCYRLGGLDPLPFRVIAYVALGLSSVLYFYLIRRLTGSAMGAGVAATFWCVHPCMTLPLTWIATTNQLLWICCALGTVVGFVKWADTGLRVYLGLAWMAYLSGFGMLEANVAVGLLLVAYALCFARGRLRGALAFVGPAVAFAVLHLLLIPRVGGAAYKMEVGVDTLRAVWTYWQWSFVLEPSATPIGVPMWAGPVTGGVLLAVTAGLAVYRPSRWVTVFGVAWWLCLLAPTLPLAKHVSDYYLAAPLLGVGLVLAAWTRQFPRLGAMAAVALLALAVPVTRSYARVNVERGENMEALVKGVRQVRASHPGRAILLAGVGDGLFWSGIYDRPFSLVGATDTYLSPDAAEGLTAYPELFRAADYTLPREVVRERVARGEMVVYTVSRRRLVDTTAMYRNGMDGGGLAASVDFRQPVEEGLLGKEWYAAEDGFRWMPKEATVRLSGKGGEVEVTGFTAAAQFEGFAELRVEAFWNGVALGMQAVPKGREDFQLRFALPEGRKEGGELQLRVDHVTTVAGDTRALGLAVTRIGIR